MSGNNKISWNTVRWRLSEARIRRIQNRIYIASKRRDKGRVTFLQDLIINSLDAKLLAVKRVTTESSGKKTPGVDTVVATTPAQKAAMVAKLQVDGKAAPIRRVWIPKPGRVEKRPLGIPVIMDRAKQKLVLMALEPEWEAKFELGSYGFRPGRSCHDAVEAIFRHLRNKTGESRGKYVLDADLKGCFDNIDHDYLLSTLKCSPRISLQVKAWLKSGIFEGLDLAPEEYGNVPENSLGTPQGGVISPFLDNVALHGMENHLKEWICGQTWPVDKRHKLYKANKIKSIGIVRYADDFVILHENKDIVEAAYSALEVWLGSTSKLAFNKDKTRLIHSSQGFDFLGFSFINVAKGGAYRVKIYPSKKNQQKLVDKVGDFCRKHRSLSTYDLVKALRPKVLGWGNYFRFCECSDVFGKMDMTIFSILRKWVFRRDKRHGKRTVKEKYFPSGQVYTFDGRNYRNNWILCGKKLIKGRKDPLVNFLPKLSWIASKKHVSIKEDASVYDGNEVYWANRAEKHSNLNARQLTLFRRQKGICPICNVRFVDSVLQVDHIVPLYKGGSDDYNNLQLLHTDCHVKKTALDR